MNANISCYFFCLFFSFRRLESPTRTLTLEAPKGVEVNAGVGEFRASCRKELTLESSEGEVSNLLVLAERSHRSLFYYSGIGACMRP